MQIDNLALYATITNDKLRYYSNIYSDEQQRVKQIIYLLYIDNAYLHKDVDCFIKIGTCTLNRFKERLVEHTRKFSTRISVIDIRFISNASVEKQFHRYMETYYPELVLHLETPDGNFKETYYCAETVFNVFNEIK